MNQEWQIMWHVAATNQTHLVRTQNQEDAKATWMEMSRDLGCSWCKIEAREVGPWVLHARVERATPEAPLVISPGEGVEIPRLPEVKS